MSATKQLCSVCQQPMPRRSKYGVCRRTVECYREWERRRNAAHPERLERPKDWYRENTEQHRRVGYEWARNNIEKVRETARRWYRNNKEKANHHVRVRRARLRGVESEKFTLAEISKRDGGRCQRCNKPVRTKGDPRHPLYANLDHIVPLSKGGSTTRENIQLLCRKCNFAKNNKLGGDQLILIG